MTKILIGSVLVQKYNSIKYKDISTKFKTITQSTRITSK